MIEYEEIEDNFSNYLNCSPKFLCKKCDKNCETEKINTTKMEFSLCNPLFDFIVHPDNSIKIISFECLSRILLHLEKDEIEKNIDQIKKIFSLCSVDDPQIRKNLISVSSIFQIVSHEISNNVLMSLSEIRVSQNPYERGFFFFFKKFFFLFKNLIYFILIEIVLLILGKLALFADHENLLLILSFLIDSLADDNLSVHYTSKVQICEIAESKNMELRELFESFGEKIYLFIVEDLAHENGTNSVAFDVILFFLFFFIFFFIFFLILRFHNYFK